MSKYLLVWRDHYPSVKDGKPHNEEVVYGELTIYDTYITIGERHGESRYIPMANLIEWVKTRE